MAEEYKKEIKEEMEATSSNPMVSWEGHVGVKEDLVTVPKCGGLFKQDDDKVMAFIGTDPDACVNVWSYNQDTKTYQADKSYLNHLWNHKKGPVWEGQFRPSSIKQIQKTEQVCTNYTGTKFDGLISKNGGAPPFTLNVYKDIICAHLIKNGMCSTV
eukprot:12046006-Ditylum_brightwellii.AAC.1